MIIQMNIFRNNSSQNVLSRGKSVGGKMFSMTGLRYMQPKFMQQVNNAPMSKVKLDSGKIEICKLSSTKNVHKDKENKENKPPIEPKQIVISKKLPAVFAKVRGFHNIGNTCYLNSTLQCILHLSKFNEEFYRENHIKGIERRHPSSTNYADIVKQLINVNSISPLNPSTFKTSIGKKNPRFLGTQQQDAQEFLTAVLECLNEELSRITAKPKYQELDGDPSKKPLSEISQEWWDYYQKRDDSVVCDYFTGQVLSKVTCKKCEAVAVTFDNIWGLPLSLSKGSRTIPQLLQIHLKNENIIEDYNCSKCKKFRDCGRTLQFFRLPEVLTIQLKRFQYGRFFNEKIKDSIKVEKELQMKHFLARQAPKQQTLYRLTGMVHHFGETEFGHYTAEVLNQGNGTWHDANDSKISEIGSIEGSSKSVYLLFFEKKYHR